MCFTDRLKRDQAASLTHAELTILTPSVFLHSFLSFNLRRAAHKAFLALPPRQLYQPPPGSIFSLHRQMFQAPDYLVPCEGERKDVYTALVVKWEFPVTAPLLAAGFRTGEQNIGVHGFIYWVAVFSRSQGTEQRNSQGDELAMSLHLLPESHFPFQYHQ